MISNNINSGKKMHQQKAKNSEEVCPICHCYFNSQISKINCPGKHAFCFKCIYEWCTKWNNDCKSNKLSWRFHFVAIEQDGADFVFAFQRHLHLGHHRLHMHADVAGAAAHITASHCFIASSKVLNLRADLVIHEILEHRYSHLTIN